MADEKRIVAVFSGGGTGGHLYPALALARGLAELRSDVRPVFVGARRGLEAKVLPGRDLEYHLFPVRGFQRGSLWRNWRVLPALAWSVGRVLMLFARLRPSLVVATGGYACGPAGIAARLLGVPLVLQEQNSVPGVAVRQMAPWAEEIHVAFPEAEAALPAGVRERVRVSGNPVRPPRALERGEARQSLELPEDGPLLLVVGGSQGAQALNSAMLQVVERVADGRLDRPEGLSVLWGTGEAHWLDTTRKLEALGDPGWVKPVGYIDDMDYALAAADLALSRAGAMATSEFLAWGLPAVLVPLPTAAADHQSRNARALAEAGAAVHLPEADLTAPGLWQVIVDLVADPERRSAMAAAARERGRPEAVADIARSLARHLPEQGRAA